MSVQAPQNVPDKAKGIRCFDANRACISIQWASPQKQLALIEEEAAFCSQVLGLCQLTGCSSARSPAPEGSCMELNLGFFPCQAAVPKHWLSGAAACFPLRSAMRVGARYAHGYRLGPWHRGVCGKQMVVVLSRWVCQSVPSSALPVAPPSADPHASR